MKNRIISWLTILILIMTAIPQTRGIAAVDVPIDKLILANFGNGEFEGCKVMDKGYPTKEDVCTRAKLDTEITYEGSESSLVWQFGNHNGVLVKMPYASLNGNACDKFNIRFYSEIPGQDIVILLNEYDTFNGQSDSRYWSGLLTTGDGWQELCVDMAKVREYWVVDNPEYIYMILITGWGKTHGSMADFEAGKADAITGEKMYVDKIWLSNSKYGAPMASPVSSIENNSDFVDPALDGNNTLTLTYEKDIYAFDDAVLVYETVAETGSGIKYVESDVSYSLEADHNKLNIVFENPLSVNNYRVVVLKDKVLSLSGEMAEADSEIYFSVGQESVLFNVTDISFKDGDVFEKSPEEITISFGTAPQKSQYVPEYISIYRDGEKVYNAYSYELSEKTLKLAFDNPLLPGNYTLKIDDDYSNIYGNAIMGSVEYHFEVIANEETDAKESIMMFEAGNSGDMANAVSNSNGFVSQYANITGFYETTAKLDSGSEFIVKEKFDLSGMKYVNYWIYNENAPDSVAEFHLYTDYAKGKSAKYPYALSDSGWNLVSLPLEDFRGDITYDVLGVRYSESDEEKYILVDAIWASAELPEEMSFVSSGFPEDFSDASTLGEVLELTYSDVINSKISPDITITDESGNKFTDFKTLVKSNTLRIEFGYLMPDTTYEVTAGRVVSDDLNMAPEKVLSFSTSDSGAYLEDIFFDKGSIKNEKTNVTFLLSNNGESECEITLCALAAGSNENSGALVQKKVTLPGNTVILAEVLSVIPDEGAKAIKAFALMPSGKMLSQKYYVLDDSGVKLEPVSYDENEAKIASAAFNVNVLDVMLGTAKKSDTVIITVENADGQAVFADVAISDNNTLKKYFEFSKNAPSGEYTVKAVCGKSKDERKITYISSSDRDALLNAANNGKTAEVKSFMISYAGVLGLENASENFVGEIADLVIEVAGFNVYADVTKFIRETAEAFEKANSGVWADLSELILEQAYLFGGQNDSDYKYYISLSEKNRNKICTKMNAKVPVDSLHELNKVFENAIDDYKDSQDSGSGGGSSGGSGKKGSSGSSSVVSDLPYITPAPYTPAQTANEFTDLSDVSWAVESIMMLREKGVVSASADKLFRPNDNITREEFIKLIICAFAPDEEESAHNFTDAPDSAWFSSYVKKAHHLGILKGYPDGSFGAGENITREDMVTLIARTLEALGNEVKYQNAPAFDDAHDISGYAYSYVASLSELKIINGMGDGTFAPKATATRAQAAKVIAGLMEKY